MCYRALSNCLSADIFVEKNRMMGRNTEVKNLVDWIFISAHNYTHKSFIFLRHFLCELIYQLD